MAFEERPVQEWFPRARAMLVIRFEEFGATISAKPPKKKQNLRKDNTPKELEYVKDPEAATRGRTVYVLQPKGGSKIAATSVDKMSHALNGVIPLSATHNRNGLDKADTLTLEFAYIDAPFDPRCIRSCGVEFYLGPITADQCAHEQDGVTTFLPDTFVDSYGRTRSNRRFRGWVDSWEVDYKEGSPIVRLECRDGRSVLIDQEAPPQLLISTKLPIHEAIADYLANFPQFAGIGVEWQGNPGEEAPKLQDFVSYNVKKLGSKGGGDKAKVMDYLMDMVGMCACILIMRDNTLIVTRPRTVLKKGAVRTDDTHKNAHRSINGMVLPNRTFVYGHDVKSMRFGRKFSMEAPSNVEVRCLLPDTIVESDNVERLYRRKYSGEIVRVFVGGLGVVLSGTSNHPVLTTRGWVSLGELVDGDYLVRCAFSERGVLGDPQVHTAPTKLVDLFGALSDAFDPERVPGREVDFHGDGMNADVDVVTTDRLLGNDPKPSAFEHLHKVVFEAARVAASFLTRHCPGELRIVNFLRWAVLATCGFVGSSCYGLEDFGRSVAKAKLLSLLVRSDGDAQLEELSLEPTTILPGLKVELPDGSSINVSLGKVIDIKREQYSGHVYNLQTRSGWYVASGIITHNCYLGRSKKTIMARFPDVTTQAMPGEGADKKWIVWRVQGVTNRETLKLIAQSVYEQSSRKELTVELETNDLASFGGDNLDPDVLDMLPGDPFDVYVLREREEFTSAGAVENAALAGNKLVELLTSMGHDRALARAYADSFSAGGFQSTFRLRTLSIEWSNEDGVSFKVSGCNFVEVRLDKEIV